MSTCATHHCEGTAERHAISEGNALGSQAPRRCRRCCDAIAQHGIPVGGLHDTAQLDPWSSIARDYRSRIDGIRHVLVLTAYGTGLARWYGPAR